MQNLFFKKRQNQNTIGINFLQNQAQDENWCCYRFPAVKKIIIPYKHVKIVLTIENFIK